MESVEAAVRLLLDGQGWVYSLRDPLTQRPFYVGTTVNPEVRLRGHMKISNAHTRALRAELQVLEDCGLAPEMVLLEEANFANLLDRENHHIDRLRDDGFRLANQKKNPPGENYGRVLSEQECDEMVRALRSGVSPVTLGSRRAISGTLLKSVEKLLRE